VIDFVLDRSTSVGTFHDSWQAAPADKHHGVEDKTDRLLNYCAEMLREETGNERKKGTATASHCAYKAQTRRLNVAREQFAENHSSTGVNRTQNQSDYGDCDRLSNDIRDEPCEQLKDNST
jgi:hypothetical protein